MEKLTALRARLASAHGIQTAFICYSLLYTFVDTVFASPDDPAFRPQDIPLLLLYSFGMFLWYRTDSEERRIRRPAWLNSLFVVSGPFGILFYTLCWDRQRRAGHVLLKSAGILMLHLVAGVAGAILWMLFH